MVGNPVVAGSPKGRVAAGTVVEFTGVEVGRCRCLTHAGKEDPILVPAGNIALAKRTEAVAIDKNLEIILAKGKTIEGEQPGVDCEPKSTSTQSGSSGVEPTSNAPAAYSIKRG